MGKVYLLGAGPGDPELLTIRAKKIIEKADCLVYDSLISEDILNLNKNALRFFCGKRKNHHFLKQEETNQLLCDLSKEYEVVVRLKGGDPYVFGRGGEEGVFLYDRNIEFEVIPAITSGIGGLLYAGIPATYRNIATSLHLITGHRTEDIKEKDYENYARLEGTLVFYMGVSNLKNIAKGLLKGGMDKNTPVGLLYNATLKDQELTVLNLDQVSKLKDYSIFKTPSLIVVGEVLNYREKLDFISRKALYGKKIVVTRAKDKSKLMSSIIEENGGQAIFLPSIREEGLDFSFEKILTDQEKYLVFTSQTGVKYFFDKFYEKFDLRALSKAKIISIGKKTTCELKKYNIQVDLETDEASQEGLVDLIRKKVKKGEKIILLKAKITRDLLKKSLEKDYQIDEIEVYETVEEKIEKEDIEKLADGFSYITFTSSSTCKSFFNNLEKVDLDKNEKEKILKLVKESSVVIGKITEKSLEDFGVMAKLVSKEQTIEDMIRIIIEDAKKENDKK